MDSHLAPTALRRRSTIARAAAVMAALALTTASAASGHAITTHYASPAGTGDCSTAAKACTLATALTGLLHQDTISLAAGSYDMNGLNVPAGLHWVATDPSAARPSLSTTAGVPTSLIAINAAAVPTTMTHIAITDHRASSSATHPAAILLGSGTSLTLTDVVLDTNSGECLDAPDPGTITIDRSTVSGRAGSGCLTLPKTSLVTRSSVAITGLSIGTPPPALQTGGVVQDTSITGGLHLSDPAAIARRVRALGIRAIEGQGTVVDSLAITRAASGAALSANEQSGGTLTAINDTAINTSTDPAAYAVNAVDDSEPTPVTDNTLVLSNTIVRGSIDIGAQPTSLCQLNYYCGQGVVTVDHSNFVTTAGDAGITRGAGNQSSDPRFTNVQAGDYHLLSGSPAIDAGAVAPAADPSDLDGAARRQGTAPDLGAFETTPPPAPILPAPVVVAPLSAASQSGIALAPILGPLHLTHAAFRVAGRPTAISAKAAKRTPVGTTLSMTLANAATVTIQVQRKGAGRRIGSSCVKVTRANRKRGRACIRWTSLSPSLHRVAARTGLFKVAFTGRVGSLHLSPATYRFAVTAANGAGRRSAPRLSTFRVVAK